jgi:hypothetical protein
VVRGVPLWAVDECSADCLRTGCGPIQRAARYGRGTKDGTGTLPNSTPHTARVRYEMACATRQNTKIGPLTRAVGGPILGVDGSPTHWGHNGGSKEDGIDHNDSTQSH